MKLLLLLLMAKAFAMPESDIFSKFLEIQNINSKKEALSLEEIQSLYQSTINNPVTNLDVISKYDPTGIIGFCFGRSMAAHLGAKKMGLHFNSIGKIFIIGALCTQTNCPTPETPPEWRFHVTTVVKGEDNNWYAIDPIMYNGQSSIPLLAAEWVKQVRNGWDTYHGKSPQAKLYFTNSNAVMPDLTELPNPESGEHIIELNFQPSEHGIRTSYALKKELGITNYKEKIYKVKTSEMQTYFLTTDPEDQTRFNFAEIVINQTDHISYNDYFTDLITFASKDAPFDFNEPMGMNPVMAKTFSQLRLTPPLWIGGFNLESMK